MAARIGPMGRTAKRALYVACEELDFTWDEDELAEVVERWEAGEPVGTIGAHFRRDPDEVLILIIDLARNGRLGRRPEGIGGHYGEICENA